MRFIAVSMVFWSGVLVKRLVTFFFMIETRRLKNVVIFIQTNLSFVLSRKIVDKAFSFSMEKITKLS